MNMKVVTHMPRREPRQILHVEVEGGIVNIYPGLFDNHGNKVTRVEIRADDYAGEAWHMPDLPGNAPESPRQHIAVRLMPFPLAQGTPVPVDELAKLRWALDIAKLRLTELSQPGRDIDYYESDPGFANEQRMIGEARAALQEIDQIMKEGD